MLTQNKGKENTFKIDLHTKEPHNLVQNTMNHLRQEISTLKVQKINIQKIYIGEIELLKLQLAEYKKKLNILTDKYLAQTFAREKDQDEPKKNQDYEQMLRENQILYEQQKQTRKKTEQKLQLSIEQTLTLKTQLQTLTLQKQKNMQLSLIQKLHLQQKTTLLNEDLQSKKSIIKNLKNELQSLHTHKQNLNKQERNIKLKSKELEYYSNQINQYNRINQLRMKQQVNQLQKENMFLKEYVKKIENGRNKECQCQEKDQKVRENMFSIKRQLALAKVKLGQQYFSSTQKDKYKNVSPQESSQQSSFSFDKRK